MKTVPNLIYFHPLLAFYNQLLAQLSINFTMRSLIKSFVVYLILCISNNAFATENSVFWEMESPTGIASYLFGTFNSDDSRITNFSPTMINAIKQVDVVMMKHSQGYNPRLTMIRGFNVKEKLTEEEFDKVRVLANYHEMYLENVVRMKPYILASLYFYTKPITGFNQNYLLLAKFAEMRKKIEYIANSQEYYKGVVDTLNIEEQLLILRAALAFTQAEKEKRYQQLIEAYLVDDLDAINTIDSDIGNRLMPASFRERYRAQNYLHIALMAERTIVAAKKRSVFIVVGSSDLGGETGLIMEYQKAGFKLTPIKNSSSSRRAD